MQWAVGDILAEASVSRSENTYWNRDTNIQRKLQQMRYPHQDYWYHKRHEDKFAATTISIAIEFDVPRVSLIHVSPI